MTPLRTSVAGHPQGITAPARRASIHPEAARPATGSLLCHYDDGKPVVAYITLSFGPIGWCKGHLSKIGTWPAEEHERWTA